jgi:hypothetical protein
MKLSKIIKPRKIRTRKPVVQKTRSEHNGWDPRSVDLVLKTNRSETALKGCGEK